MIVTLFVVGFIGLIEYYLRPRLDYTRTKHLLLWFNWGYSRAYIEIY